jgi:hypothetical protein
MIYRNIHKGIICNQKFTQRTRSNRERDTTKKVTKPKYCRLLSIIGRSNDPMSKHEIERAFTKESDPSQKSKKGHVYRMIRSLSAEDRRSSVKFLDIQLKEKCLKRISKLGDEHNEDFFQIPEVFISKSRISSYFESITGQKQQAIDEVKEMCRETRNYRYILNFRGFLLLLKGESKSTIYDSRDRIRKVILNPSIIDRVPFLMYWQDFEEMDFDAIDTLEGLVKDLESAILDPTINPKYLLLRITERYYEKVTRHFDFLEEFILIDWRHRKQLKKYDELQISKKIRKYRLTMLKMLKRLLLEQVAIVDRIYKMYSRY